MIADSTERKRTFFYLSVVGLLVCVAAVTAVSARDPSGVSFRVGMVLMTVGAASLVSRPIMAVVATVVIWLAPNAARSAVQDVELFGTNMLLELAPLIGIAMFTGIARRHIDNLDAGSKPGPPAEIEDVDPLTGAYDERLLRSALEMEVARARRFNREFAFVLVGIDAMRQRFDYRDEAAWEASFIATAKLLRGTRHNVDRVYRYGISSFALLLPESNAKDVQGLVRRLRRAARRSTPAEGEPGGPLPCHYGATFFPQAANTIDELLRRAEVALRVAENSPTRLQLDAAEAAELVPPETLRSAMTEERPVALQAFRDGPGPAEPAQVAPHAGAVMPTAELPPPISLAASRRPVEGSPRPQPDQAEPAPPRGELPPPQPITPHLPPEPQQPSLPLDPALDDALLRLLQRMEETEELMRSLRKAS